MSNPYQVVKDFEAALCEYTGAKYAVTTTSCTMALLLALKWEGAETVSIPCRTYIGVPMSVINAGAEVMFLDDDWEGCYCLGLTAVWDYARRLRRDMYVPGQMQCLSFHWTKILSIGQGGAILHDNPWADRYLRRMRFDGRTEGVPSSEDAPTEVGYHAYMSPRDAAEGLSRLATLPSFNEDLPWDDYPDLSQMDIFK